MNAAAEPPATPAATASADPHRLRLIHATTIPLALLWFLTSHLKYMAAHGLEVFTVSSPGAEIEHLPKDPHIHHFVVPMERRISLWRDLKSLVRMIDTQRRIGPSIVHAHTPKAGFLSMIAAALLRVPVRIYHIHGFPYMTARGPKRWLLMAIEWLACRLAHNVFCVSHSIRNVAIRDRICSPQKMRVILEGSIAGIDVEKRYNPARYPAADTQDLRRRLGLTGVTIGFVGRLVRDKGVVELLEAWKVLREEFPTSQLLIVGPIETADAVPDAYLQQVAADPRIHHTGGVLDVGPYYAAMDLLTLPSFREGFGLALLEASAMCKPVVATAIPGCADAVADGRTGTLVPAGDIPALTAALRAYLADDELRQQHGEAGRQRVLESFDERRVLAAFHAAYATLWRESGH